MNAWIFVPASFGLWWLASGLSALMPLTAGTWAILIVGALAVVGCGLYRRDPPRNFDKRKFRYSVLAESIGIIVVLFSCNLLRRPDLIMPLLGTVVGLHFLPLAKAFRDHRFIVAGCLLTAISLIAFFWSPPLRTAIAGIGAGAILWIFALWTSLQPRLVS